VNLDEALSELLPDNKRTGDTQADLVAAAAEAWRRRHVNTEAGAAVIAALTDRGLSYRQIADLTGIPAATAHRWARPPEQDTG
jgi:DNA-directed RNA polymerase specialized sigma24 family protein